MRMSPQTTRTRGTIRRRPVYSRPLAASASSSGRTCRETSLHQNPLPRCTSRMATNSVELTPALTGPTRPISGSFSPATWHSSSTMARRCRCLPAMSWCRTELATVGAWLGTCRPPWLLSSSEPTAVRFRPTREVAIAMTWEERCGAAWEAVRPDFKNLRHATRGVKREKGRKRLTFSVGLRFGTNHSGVLGGFWKLNDAESANFHCVPNQVQAASAVGLVPDEEVHSSCSRKLCVARNYGIGCGLTKPTRPELT